MLGFQSAELVQNHSFYRIWNDGLIALVHVFGEIDDERAREWTGAILEICLGPRSPRFVIVDISDIDSHTTLAERMHTAHVARQILHRCDYMIVFIGQNLTASFVAQVVLRAAGVQNFAFMKNLQELEEAVARMRLGLLPFAGSDRKFA